MDWDIIRPWIWWAYRHVPELQWLFVYGAVFCFTIALAAALYPERRTNDDG